MSLFATVSITLGTSIAKHIVKQWLGDGLPNTLAGNLIDETQSQLKRWLTDAPPQDPVEQIGQDIASRMEPFFQKETHTLTDNDRAALIMAVSQTLDQAKINATLIIQRKLSATALADHIMNRPPTALSLLDPHLIPPAQRMLTATCQEIINVAATLSGYEIARTRQSLRNDGEILEQLARLYHRPSEKAARFEKQYRQAIVEALDRFEQFGIPHADEASRRQSLDVAHVTLDVEYLPSQDPRFMDEIDYVDEIAPFREGRRPEYWADRHHQQERFVRSSPVDQVLSSARKLVIRGRAGSGKSTLLQWMAIQAAKQNFPPALADWNDYVPFFIRLREYVQSEFPPPEKFVEAVAPMIAGNMPDGWVHELLEQGRALILIDGIDELPAAERGPMLERVRKLLSTSSIFVRYIFSSRPAAINQDEWPQWHEWVQDEELATVTLQDMQPHQVDQFVERWHEALFESEKDLVERRELQKLPDALKALIKNRPALQKLAINPLLCAMICSLHREAGPSLPEERLSLYQDCIDMLLNRRDVKRGMLL